jgi:hypothetical protein
LLLITWRNDLVNEPRHMIGPVDNCETQNIS